MQEYLLRSLVVLREVFLARRLALWPRRGGQGFASDWTGHLLDGSRGLAEALRGERAAGKWGSDRRSKER